MNYYVFRINYTDPKAYSMLKDELICGKLRQGWGSTNMSVAQDFEGYESAWHSAWGEDDAERNYILGKYNNIHLMTEMQPGDIIIIPKVSLSDENGWNSFTIAKCTGSYCFEPIENDFGHIIPVEPIVSFRYLHNDSSLTVSAKFKAYQRPVNRVYNTDFTAAIELLRKKHEQDPSIALQADSTPLKSLSAPTLSAKLDYLNKIVEQINLWNPSQLERIIEELFVSNGYEKRANNRYDREGGDIDLVFAPYPKNSLMQQFYATSSSLDMQEIRVQAKKKIGKDTNDLEGILQLAKMDGHETSINILINTTTSFSDEAKEEAAKEVFSLSMASNLPDFLSNLVWIFLTNSSKYKTLPSNLKQQAR